MSTAPTPGSTPSIKDVAALAGVSAQTVSRVANEHPSVRPQTRERVERAMLQLGYRPNRAARALRRGSTRTIGVMAHRLERTGEALTMSAVVDAAEERGYSVTLTSIADPAGTDWQHTSARLAQQAIDALVIIRNEATTPDRLPLPAGFPVAVSDSRLVGRHPAVVTDQLSGARAAVEHLPALGHRQVHHLAGPATSEPAQIRLASWRRSLELAGIQPPPEVRGDWSAGSGYLAGQRLARDPGVTAVFCANDEMAFGLVRALHEAGRRVPEEVSVVGFDDIALAGYASVPLTTVHQDFHRVGVELVELVMRQLEGPGAEALDRVVVPTELVVRASTAPPAELR